jgi:hypothetical protein
LEEYKRRWQILVSSQGVVQGFRANIVRLYKRKAQIIILESRNNLEKTVVVLPKSFWKSKSVEYLGRYTHKIAIKNHTKVYDQNKLLGTKIIE